MKFAIVAPVAKPTPLSAGSPSSSRNHAAATSSTATDAGVTLRSTVFWSQAQTSQSAASAAGWEPPITNPKKRPDGIAVSPGSQAVASRSTTSSGGVGPSGSSRPSASATASASACGLTGRSRQAGQPAARVGMGAVEGG